MKTAVQVLVFLAALVGVALGAFALGQQQATARLEAEAERESEYRRGYLDGQKKIYDEWDNRK
ncbi:MAG: hypothetical protein IT464_12625 [Planctomycetes bacterium]|nr:hypothetical protein [Planctomycetota bacterium]